MDQKQQEAFIRQQKQAQAMQQIKNEKHEMKENLLRQRMTETLLPKDFLSDQFRQHTKMAIRQSNPMSHKLSLKDFGYCVRASKNEDVNLFQFQTLTNSLETVSPDQLNLSDDEYDEFICYVVDRIAEWHKLIVKIEEELIIQVEEEYKVKMAESKINKLKPVQAEA